MRLLQLLGVLPFVPSGLAFFLLVTRGADSPLVYLTAVSMCVGLGLAQTSSWPALSRAIHASFLKFVDTAGCMTKPVCCLNHTPLAEAAEEGERIGSSTVSQSNVLKDSRHVA
jgi:hypothetical protein